MKTHTTSKSTDAIVMASWWLGRALVLATLLTVAPRGGTQQTSSSSDFKEAERLLQGHRLAEAKTATLDQLERHPSSIEGYNLLGIIQSNQEDFAGAIASFQKALQLNPRSSKSHNNLGDVYAAQKQFDHAEKDFRDVLLGDPSNSYSN